MNVSFDKVVHVELSSKVALNDDLIYRTLEIVTSDGKKYEISTMFDYDPENDFMQRRTSTKDDAGIVDLGL